MLGDIRITCSGPTLMARVVLVVLASAALAASAQTEQRRRVVFGGDHKYAPYEFLDESGRPSGFNVDIARAVCEVTGLEFHIKLEPWAKVRADLESGRIDAISGMSYSAQRDRLVDFSTPHSITYRSVFVRKGSPISSLADVKGKEIIVQRGDIMHDCMLAEGLSDRIILVQDQADTLKLLASGKHDCALLSELQGRYLATKLGLVEIVAVGGPIYPQEYCFAVQEGDAQLQALLNRGLHIVKTTGRYAEIYDKWFGVTQQPAQVTFGAVARSAAWVVLPLLGLLAAAVLWSATLRRSVRRQTQRYRQQLLARRKAQDALSAGEARFRMLLEQSLMGISIIHKDVFEYVNKATADTVGYSVEEMLRWGPGEFGKLIIHRDDRAAFMGQLTRNQSGANDVVANYYWRLVAKSGQVRWIESSSKSIPFADGTAAIVTFVDVTERKHAEEALRRSEENLAITLDCIGDAVIATDAEGNVARMNPVAEKLTGYTAADALGKPLTEVFQTVVPSSPDGERQAVPSVSASGEVEAITPGTVLVARDGTRRRIADSGAPIRNAEGQTVGVVLVFRDVTEEFTLQDQLRQAQKMEAVGQLAGGVAHDFNNLLTAILGNGQLLSMKLPPHCEEAALAGEIVKASVRAADLTRQLLTFSRKGQMRIVSVDVHQVIEEVARLLVHSIDRRIEIRQDLAATRAIVRGDPALLQNAILNLGVNARDAMPDGGKLTFSTRNLHVDEEYCRMRAHEISPGDYLEVRVTDTGIGMDEELQKRIFEPFFTTKDTSEGTGLGLAGVYGCVKSHHGLIEVDSEVGKGSSFRALLLLPTPGIKAPAATAEAAALRGSGHILVVDDEDIVRTFAARALRNLGYTVSTCDDGAEAVDFYRLNHERIDLVILDLMMPKLGGEDAFKLMKKIDPDVRVLIASGFSRRRVADALSRDGAAGFLAKPFQMTQLSQLVARNIRRR